MIHLWGRTVAYHCREMIPHGYSSALQRCVGLRCYIVCNLRLSDLTRRLHCVQYVHARRPTPDNTKKNFFCFCFRSVHLRTRITSVAAAHDELIE